MTTIADGTHAAHSTTSGRRASRLVLPGAGE
jgi:hypothetical protein